MRKAALIASAICAIALTQPASAAELWRMYKCVGDQGETVFSDKAIGTDCREIWLNPRAQDSSGWFVSDPAVGIAQTNQQEETDE